MGFIKRAFGFISNPSQSRTTGIVAMLILIFAVFLTVVIAQQKQTIKQSAAANSIFTGACYVGNLSSDACTVGGFDSNCNASASGVDGNTCCRNSGFSGCRAASSVRECGFFMVVPQIECYGAPSCTCPTDGNECTTDACVNNACTHTNKSDGTACTDSAWNSGTCKNGACDTTTRGECGSSVNPDLDCWKTPYATDCSTGKCNTTNRTCYAEPKNVNGSCNNGSGQCKSDGTCGSVSLCCPAGYDTNFGSCPFGVTSTECCKWNGFFNYTIVSKIPCGSNQTPATTRTVTTTDTCTPSGGTCMSGSCGSGYTPTTSGTCASGYVCCKQSTAPITITYTCTNTSGQSCMSGSCGSGYTPTTSGTCASGTVCCKASTNPPVVPPVTTTCSVSGNTCTDSSGSKSGSCSENNVNSYSCVNSICQSSTTTCPTEQPCAISSSGIPACGGSTSTTNIALVSALNARDTSLTSDTLPINLILYNLTTNNQVAGAPATVTFNKTSIPGRLYSANVVLTNLTQNKYFIVFRKDNMIAQSVFTISSSSGTFTVPTTTLVFGDLNNDNAIDPLDWNIFKSCWKQPTTTSCSSSDFDNSGGSIDQVDYNTFLRGYSTWYEEGKTNSVF